MALNTFPNDLSQNKELSIRVVSREFGHISAQSAAQYSNTQRLPYYFLLFVMDGNSQQVIDLETINIGKHELFFALPHQLRELPAIVHGTDYYKLGFDDECLAQLPKKFVFLINPLNQQKISFTTDAAHRLRDIFNILTTLLRTDTTAPELILAYLNTLLTEINSAYFAAAKKPAAEDLDKFIGFKVFVENNLTNHPAITEIAGKLALSTDCLYRIVKEHSGVSPKEFITDRLIMEARRRMYAGQNISVKELAFELGFNDPSYFSRLFKKVTGKTIAAFYRDLSV